MTPSTSFVRVGLGAFALALTCFSPSIATADVAEEAPTLTITSPSDGATFPGPSADIAVTVDVDTTFSFEDLSALSLTVNGETVATQEGPGPYTDFEISLEEGMYELIAVGTHPVPGAVSEPIAIAVLNENPSGDGDTSEGADEDTDDGDDGGGCQISPDEDSSRDLGLGLCIALGLGTLVWRRRD